MSAPLSLPVRGTPGRLVKSLAGLAAGRTPAPLFPLLALEGVTSKPWSSATFDGARHRLDLRLHGSADEIGAALDRIVDGIAEHEFDLPGQIVASARLVGVSVDPDPMVVALALTVEVLTVLD